MIDTTVPYMIWVIFTAFTGMIAIGAGIIGFWYRKMYWFERIIAIIAGLMLMYPEGMSDTIGLGLFIALIASQIITKNKGKYKAA